ncbi:AMP-binding protein [Streptomyces mirabilis]|uniref:AMP-binding protein n=1 Tax=Streptomyces mirabilis TaxID=68239 RepID=UPI002253E128|nr:AMP-binding protein [Streptomyces mirabilis]MCX4420249.1 AMP-binding protein [Streptomyces mirabilis]
MLESSARAVPDRAAVVLGDQRLTYAELDTAARRVANLLRSRGVEPGDKVALSCPNLPWFPVVYYGILKAGAVVVPLNVLLKGRQIAYHLADSEAKAYFCFEGSAELPLGQEGWTGFGETPGCEHFFLMTAAPAEDSPIAGAQTLTAALAGQSADFETVATEADDTAVILYTSGTTGLPKGAELSHSNVTLNALTCHKLFGEVEHEVHLIALPLFHSFGQTVQMNAGLAARATLVLMPRFDSASALALMQRHAVTFFAGVPTMYWALLGEDAPDVDLARIAGNLRIVGSGGSALPVEIHRRFHERFGVTILEGYGLSETSRTVCGSWRGRLLVSGCAWRTLPPCFGASKSTVHRRFAIRSRAGVWGRLHQKVLQLLDEEDLVDLSRAVLDPSHVRWWLRGTSDPDSVGALTGLGAAGDLQRSALSCRRPPSVSPPGGSGGVRTWRESSRYRLPRSSRGGPRWAERRHASWLSARPSCHSRGPSLSSP